MSSSVYGHSFYFSLHTFDQTLTQYKTRKFLLPRLPLSRLPTLYFNVSPQVLGRIKVRAVSRPLEKLDVVAIQKVLYNFRTVTRGAILNKYLTLVNVHVKF